MMTEQSLQLLQSLQTDDQPLAAEARAVQDSLTHLIDLEKDCRTKLLEAAEAQRKNIKAYNQARYRLFLERMEERNQGFCMRCRQLVPKEMLGLLYIEETRWTGSEYAQGLADERTLYTACAMCIEQARDNSGRRDGDCSFDAYHGRKQADGYEYRSPYGWASVPERAAQALLPPEVPEKLVAELSIPPVIGLENPGCSLEVNLLVGKQKQPITDDHWTLLRHFR